MKKIFLTGAAGFIGYHLAQALSLRGDSVLGYDNFNDYYSPQLKKDRSKKLQEFNIKILENDLCDQKSLSNAIKSYKPTHIVHLAAQTGVRYSLENPLAYVKSNLEGFVHLLEACRNTPTTPLIYASSSSIYGMNKKIPFSVEDRSDHPVSLYGATKKSNELMAYAYHDLYGIPVTGLRFFTVYGPWGRPDMAYYSFTKDILEGKTISLYNNGKMSRDFTYIDDIISGIISSIDHSYPYEIFNLGNHQPVTLETFVSTIEEALGKQAKKEYLPMQSGDVVSTFADIEHTEKLLGFKPKTSLKEGITQFTNWFQSYHKNLLPK